MPYIRKEFRQALTPVASKPIGPGELNFVLTTVCNQYIKDGGLSYASVNDVIGALECAKLEMYRRQVAPYEDKKKEENGDVYSVGG